MDKRKLKEAVDAVDAEGTELDASLTDIVPPGAYELCGRPARVLSAADIRIVNRVMQQCDDIDEMEGLQILLYCLLETDIGALWKLARNPERMRDRVFAWAAGVVAGEFADLVRAATPVWQEFADVTERLQAGEDGDDSKKKTGSQSSLSSPAVSKDLAEPKPSGGRL